LSSNEPREAGPDATQSQESEIREPPTKLSESIRHLGPGLIITASIVGSGELIVTTKLGADHGFTLLWFIILGCLVKVLVQVELGRYAILEGVPTLEIFDRIPGPRCIVSWVVWLWLAMFLAVMFQVSGIIGSTAAVFTPDRDGGAHPVSVILVVISCALLLRVGKYALIQRFSTLMVGGFTLFTVAAVGALYAQGYGITLSQLTSGLKFHLPDDLTAAVAAFGIIGVGASELIYYPYWCVEKGYARFVGPREEPSPVGEERNADSAVPGSGFTQAKEGSADWTRRARGWIAVMRLDAWVSAIVYTVATVAFYLLGAAVLHARNVPVDDKQLIGNLSRMYSETFGSAGYVIFLGGAFIVLYSTFFVSTASNARLLAHALSLFRVLKYPTEADRDRMVRFAGVLIPILGAVLYLSWEKPVTLVFIGAVAQAMMLAPIALCSVYLRHRRIPKSLQPGPLWTSFLWLASLAMAAVALYQVVSTVLGYFALGG